MPELPEIEAYLAALRPRVEGAVLENVRVSSPSLLRTYDPSPDAARGKRVASLERMGKRIVFGLEDDLFLVVHLMVAGRFAVDGAREGDPSPIRAGSLRLRRRHVDADGGRNQEAGFAPRRCGGARHWPP